MEPLDQTVGNAVRVLAQVVQELCLRRNVAEACPPSLNRTQFMILNLLCARRAFAVGEIASVMHVTPPAVCRAVDRLEALALVVRRPRAGDRRTHDVLLRPAGRALMERFVEISEARQERVLAHFAAEEKEQLLALLRRFIRVALDDEPDIETICLHCIDRGGEHCVLPDHDTRCLRRRDQPHDGRDAAGAPPGR